MYCLKYPIDFASAQFVLYTQLACQHRDPARMESCFLALLMYIYDAEPEKIESDSMTQDYCGPALSEKTF